MNLTIKCTIGSQNIHKLIHKQVECAFAELRQKNRYGLTRPIRSFCHAKSGCTIHHQRVDYWIDADVGRMIPLRIERLPSRPKRKYLRKLIGDNLIPTLLIFPEMKYQTILRKVAKCIKLWIDRLRRNADALKFFARNPHLEPARELPRMPMSDCRSHLTRKMARVNSYYS